MDDSHQDTLSCGLGTYNESASVACGPRAERAAAGKRAEFAATDFESKTARGRCSGDFRLRLWRSHARLSARSDGEAQERIPGNFGREIQIDLVRKGGCDFGDSE